jgi:hypothetical protein
MMSPAASTPATSFLTEHLISSLQNSGGASAPPLFSFAGRDPSLKRVRTPPGTEIAKLASAKGRLFLVGLICDLDVGGGPWCPLNIGGHVSMSGEPQRSRRKWSGAFKRRVVAEAAELGVSVASVARRHDLNANLLFNWRRRCGAEGCFLPVALVPCPTTPAAWCTRR